MTNRRDDGSATVLALAVCAVLGLVTAVLAGIGLATVTRHRAALASDAAALAAAAHTPEGVAAACDAAQHALALNGAQLVHCAVNGPYAVIRGRIDAPRWISWAGSAVGEAKAGPDADAEKSGGVARAS
ncbi:MAG TPA: Rv3654c family TadE-like protein [Mycobacteriales bacterium]|nr:Rv3654c family TadE-like protein [Mycobacteriales bacterium]